MYITEGHDGSGIYHNAEYKHPMDPVTHARQLRAESYATDTSVGQQQFVPRSSEGNLEDFFGGNDWTAAFVDQGLGFGSGAGGYDGWGLR